MSGPVGAPPILLLQHIGCEPAAAYEDELRARGLSLHAVHLDEGEALPDWRDYRAIVAMGGPMGAEDDHALPWIGAEKQLIAEAVHAGTAFWGVCLGAQLLAASLGAAVSTGPLPEVGVLPVQLTEAATDDPVFSAAPVSFPALQWHGDTYELPDGATQLARSELYEQQAFVFRRAYALQFHLEVSAAMIAEWGAVPAYAGSLAQLSGSDPLGGLVSEVSAAAPAAIALARELFGRWLEHVAGLAPAR
jgi:GMP synthase (glutamine-hydrolysing)